MKRWRMVVEFTWNWEEGDTPFEVVDMLGQSTPRRRFGTGPELGRAKDSLNELIGGKPFAHFHVLELPHSCHEFD